MPSLPPYVTRGQRLSFGGEICTVRYVGTIDGQGDKTYLGVEWDTDTRGKHNGTFQGRKYFHCLSPSNKAASFLPLVASRKPDPELSFLEGIRQKYASEVTLEPNPVSSNTPIEISGKVVEEVGFDKVRQQLAKLDGLRNIILTGQRVGLASKPGEDDIASVCPNIELVDLTRNLINNFYDIVTICKGLPRLRTLKLNENRFMDLGPYRPDNAIMLVASKVCELGITLSQLEKYQKSLAIITEVEMQKCLLTWDKLQRAMSFFTSLKSFDGSRNHLTSIYSCATKFSKLTTLILDHNEFTSIFHVMLLRNISSLEVLRLKGNKIATIRPKPDFPKYLRPFPLSLRYVDLSSNAITNWEFVEDLPFIFPGLRELRISDNPVYGSTSMSAGMNAAAEKAYMYTVAMIPDLESLNFSKITQADRTNAEIFYLSKIAKHMASVPQEQEQAVASGYKRFDALCDRYGAPVIIRHHVGHVDPNSLEARLITFKFYLPENSLPSQPKLVWLVKEIPKSFDIYRVKGLIGHPLGVQPLKLRLIWETGEWDPVAGYEDEGETYDEEAEVDADTQSSPENGRMVRREVELEDGTRQVGNWVDGSEATVRVEIIA